MGTLNPEKVEDLMVVKCNLELLRIIGRRHETCLFSVLFLTDFNFQIQLREAVKKNPDILRSGLGLGLGLLGQKITRINILSLPFKGVDIKLG